MVKAEAGLGFAFKRIPVGASGFKQRKGAVDVGAQEFARAMNRPVDMGLGSEMNDGARLMLYELAVDQGAITDIARHEAVPGIALQAGKVLKIARVGKLVQVDDRLVTLFEPVQHKITANKASVTGNKDTHRDL